jgi:hypothetical protein
MHIAAYTCGIGHILVKVGFEKISINFCHRDLIFSEPNIDYYPNKSNKYLSPFKQGRK